MSVFDYNGDSGVFTLAGAVPADASGVWPAFTFTFPTNSKGPLEAWGVLATCSGGASDDLSYYWRTTMRIRALTDTPGGLVIEHLAIRAHHSDRAVGRHETSKL